MNPYNMPCKEEIIQYFNAISLKPIVITLENDLTPLDKKHLWALNFMDFTPYQIITEKQESLYILYDKNRESFYAFCDGIREIGDYTASNLKGLLTLLPIDYFKDYELEIVKVFDDEILDYQECLLSYLQEQSKLQELDSKNSNHQQSQTNKFKKHR